MTQRQLHFFKNKNATEETSWAVPNWTSDEPEDWKQGAQVEAGRHEREAVCFKVRRESEKSGNQTVMKASPSSYGVLIVVDQDTAGLILTWPSRCTCSRWPSPIYLFDSFIFYFLCFWGSPFPKEKLQRQRQEWFEALQYTSRYPAFQRQICTTFQTLKIFWRRLRGNIFKTIMVSCKVFFLIIIVQPSTATTPHMLLCRHRQTCRPILIDTRNVRFSLQRNQKARRGDKGVGNSRWDHTSRGCIRASCKR